MRLLKKSGRLCDPRLISAVRSSRQPLRGFLRMRKSLMPSTTFLMLRALLGASRSTHRSRCSGCRYYAARFFTRSCRRGWRDVQSSTQLMIATCRPQKGPSLRGAAGDEAISMIGRVSCPRLPRYARNDAKGDIPVIARSRRRRRNLSGCPCAAGRRSGNRRCSRSARAARSRPSPRGSLRRPGSPVAPSPVPGRG
jgi:hypothetical protein